MNVQREHFEATKCPAVDSFPQTHTQSRNEHANSQSSCRGAKTKVNKHDSAI